MDRRTVITIFFAALLGFFPGLASAQNNLKEVGRIRMGVSKVNITPDKPTMMSGYEARKTPSVGVRDSLYASAFYFTNDKVKSLLITADLIGFSFGFVEEMTGVISSQIDIPAENILFVAAHNHGGPSVGEKGHESVVEYTAILKKKLADLAVNAAKNPVPVRMGVGKGSCSLNINRRAEFTKGEVWLGRNPEGPCDHELDVVKFETADKKLLAILVNWPCHGTATGDSNYLVTGDWLGASARYIEKQMGEDVVVGVTAGASGDINPIYGPGNVFREVDAIGYHVGDEAVNVLAHTPTFPLKTLQVINKTVAFPGKKSGKDHFPQSSYEPGPDASVRLSALKVGSLVFAGISGEVFTEMGMAIKKQSPYSETIVMTHCNGSSGYICTDSSYPKGGYEVKVTKMMPGAEKSLVREYVSLIHSFEY